MFEYAGSFVLRIFPTEIADKLQASMPHLLLENGLAQWQTDTIMEGDKY
jgi:hypothetical protein